MIIITFLHKELLFLWKFGKKVDLEAKVTE